MAVVGAEVAEIEDLMVAVGLEEEVEGLEDAMKGLDEAVKEMEGEEEDYKKTIAEYCSSYTAVIYSSSGARYYYRPS